MKLHACTHTHTHTEQGALNKIDDSDQFGYYLDARGVVSRISQHNGFGLLLVSFIMFLWIIHT